MAASGLRRIVEKFDDELRFFRGWVDKPRTVGSIVPTSSITARYMASVVDTTSGLPALEVGPGTGVVTRAILKRGVEPRQLYAVEYSHAFATHLKRNYPGVNVIEGDGFDLDRTLGDNADTMFDSVVSGVPLLNFPVALRVSYLENLLKRIPHGRPVVQLTYGPKSPIPAGLGDYTIERFQFILRNIPPTQLWIYRRARKQA
ncbi:MAG: methyltransferase domain-containing protein [Mesorhizobium sp.]|nr:class I SAM-dependent methyltransferase [Mesorhizobium sp.]MBL8576860.1 methyltransferase domain-containing protein [Mesorhizobium sp.]